MITIHQRHRRTDRQTTCYGNTALCTKVHRAVKTETKWHRLLFLTLQCMRIMTILSTCSIVTVEKVTKVTALKTAVLSVVCKLLDLEWIRMADKAFNVTQAICCSIDHMPLPMVFQSIPFLITVFLSSLCRESLYQ